MSSVRLEMGEKSNRERAVGPFSLSIVSCACTLHALRKLLASWCRFGNGDLESLDKTIHHDARGGRTGFGSGSHGLEERSSLSFDQGCQFVSSKS